MHPFRNLSKFKNNFIRAAAVLCAGILFLLRVSIPVRAAPVTGKIWQEEGRYSFAIDSKKLFDINSVSTDTDYQSSLLFTNASDKSMKVRLIKTEELTDGTSLYKDSYMKIRDTQSPSGTWLYAGPLADSEFLMTLSPGETRTAEFIYRIRSAYGIRRPDNSLMGSHMMWRYTFVAEWNDEPGHATPAKHPTAAPTPSPDSGSTENKNESSIRTAAPSPGQQVSAQNSGTGSETGSIQTAADADKNPGQVSSGTDQRIDASSENSSNNNSSDVSSADGSVYTASGNDVAVEKESDGTIHVTLSRNVQTDDHGHLLLWLLLMGCASSLAVLVYKRREENNLNGKSSKCN